MLFFYLGACLTRLEVRVGTPTLHATPNPLVVVVVITTQLLFFKEIQNSLLTSFSFLFNQSG